MKGVWTTLLVAMIGAQSVLAQSPPRLVPASGVAADAAGSLHAGGVVEVAFAIYTAPEAGDLIWSETQRLTIDQTGRYSTLLGLTEKEGLPKALFESSGARWLGVSVNGGPEGPRTFWASVPYALKAADADTVGGLPIEAFVVNAAYRKPDGSPAPPKPDVDGMPVGAPAVSDDPKDNLVVAEDLIAQGSICAGLDCPAAPSFGFDTIRLMENNVRIQFNDTSATGSFATNNWQLRANDSASGGANFFGIVDQGATGESETGTVVFRVAAGAPANAVNVGSTGRLGLRTATPVLDIHAVTSNTPAMRLEQDGSGGFSPRTWDIAGNEAGFFVRDVNAGSTLPFRILPGSASNALVVAGSSNVGVGTLAPSAALHVNRSAGAFANVLELTNNSGVGFVLNNTTRNRVFMSVNNPGTSFTINFDDGDPAELSLSEAGALTGVTSCSGCSPPSDRRLKENFWPVNSDDVLNRLLKLDVSSWNYKTINSSERHIGPMSQDFFDTFAVGNDVTLNPVDTFGVTTAAIQALSSRISDLQKMVLELQAEIDKLKRER
jgi:hypothetical protein